MAAWTTHYEPEPPSRAGFWLALLLLIAGGLGACSLTGCTSLGSSEEDQRALSVAVGVFAGHAADESLPPLAREVALDAWAYSAWVRWRLVDGDLRNLDLGVVAWLQGIDPEHPDVAGWLEEHRVKSWPPEGE